jgi:hypothetical protein
LKYFIDTEFIDNGLGPIHLLSIGILAEDGREYYAVNADCPLEEANDWVREHVLPQIDAALARPKLEIRQELEAFVAAGGGEPPEWWGYQVSYDWVVFCQIWGTVNELPEGWPNHFRDLKQWGLFLGLRDRTEMPPQEIGKHHALDDARWNRVAWEYLEKLQRGRVDGAAAGRRIDPDHAGVVAVWRLLRKPHPERVRVRLDEAQQSFRLLGQRVAVLLRQWRERRHHQRRGLLRSFDRPGAAGEAIEEKGAPDSQPR